MSDMLANERRRLRESLEDILLYTEEFEQSHDKTLVLAIAVTAANALSKNPRVITRPQSKSAGKAKGWGEA